MKRLIFSFLLALPLSGWAQSGDDTPIPYEDDDEVQGDAPRPARQVTEHERKTADDTGEDETAYEVSRGHLDDPNLGLSVEGLAGAMLLDAARGALADPRFMAGARLTWEYGRLLSDEDLREVFFADLTWQATATGDGTAQVRADTTYHDFSIAPAFAWKFSPAPVALFAQVGAGVSYVSSQLRVGETTTEVDGVRFLFQYGLGMRFRPGIVARHGKDVLRLSFRLEVTRFVRGIMHDTFLGGSAGLTF